MKVKSLNNELFEESCRQLAEKIAGSGYSPNVIVGIKTGGMYVADIVHKSFEVSTLTCALSQRPSTGKKNRIKKFLKLLPVCLLDLMRIAEAKIINATGSRERDITFDDVGLIKSGSSVLVVDDAVDSGNTLLNVVREIALRCDVKEVKTAVLTVTTSNPVIQPDYVLFDKRILLRFPWSMDMKRK